MPDTKTGDMAPAPAVRGILRAALGWLTARPLLLLSLLIAAQTVPSLWSKDVWLPDEVRHAAVFLQMIENGHWLALQLGENFYADKPPLYFWFLAAIWSVLRTTDPVLFMVAAALSAWAYLAVHHGAARVLGFGRNVALAAGLILLSNWFFLERAHQPRMDLMFAVFIMLSHLGFFRAVERPGRPDTGWILFGFGMGALSVLVKGPLGMVFPLLALFAHLARGRRLKDLLSPAMGFGLGLFVAIMAAYLGGVAWIKGADFIKALIFDQTIDRGINVGFHSKPFYYYVPQFALALLPWTAVLIVFPWQSMATRDWWHGHLRAVPGEHAGRAYLWAALASGVGFLSLLDYKNSFFLVPLIGIAAILAADALDRASPGRRRAVMLSVAAIFLILGVVAPFASDFTVWPIRIQGLWLLAGCLVTAAVLVALASGRRLTTATLAAALGISLVAQPLYLVTMASLNPVMSPRIVASVMRNLADEGHALGHYHRFNLGELDYHAGRPIRHFDRMRDLTRFVLTEPCGAVSILKPYYERWSARPLDVDLEIVHRYRLDYNENLVVRWTNGDCGQG